MENHKQCHTKIPALALASPSGDIRCLCERLLAKLTAQGLEVACPRCKRVRIIPLSAIEGWFTPFPVPHDPFS